MISLEDQYKRHVQEIELTGITVPLFWRQEDFAALERFTKRMRFDGSVRWIEGGEELKGEPLKKEV